MIADKENNQKWYGNGKDNADQGSNANKGIATETQGRAGQIVRYDPKKIRDVEFDINITESTATPVYRQMANDFLMQLWQAQAITLEQLLQVGDFPFGDELLQSVSSQQEAIKNGETPAGFSPQLQAQVDQASQSNPKAQAMLQQMMSGQGVKPSEQYAPLSA